APVRFDPVRAGAALLSLLTDLNAVEGIARIRLSSLEPRIMTESFIRRLSKLEKVCPHFHLSLQSGCDETLRRMNRHYTTEEYFRSVRLLRTFYDRPAITTDVIVGFPGETEAEFAATCAFLEKIRFYEIHVFRYSKRNGTVAAKMKNQIPEPVKAVRSDRLLAMTAAQAADYRAQFAGEPETLLLEELLEEQGGKYWVGSTARYVTGAVPAAEIAGEGPAGPAGTLLRGSFTARCLPFSRGEAMLFLPAEEHGREPGRNNLPAADA
ncbi:MAG: radical SAM protein, partial [Eubacteriales bacterium]|nr:radical SAM protein [Eubacteriales bacterium]